MDIICDLVFNNPYNNLEISDDIELYYTNQNSPVIAPNSTATGQRSQKIKKLTKSLLSTSCENNCNYCPFRANRDFRRKTYTPDEIAKAFMSIYQHEISDGIFLSSGIINGGSKTQDKLIETAEILRIKYNFQGYLHLKIMPGANTSQLDRSIELADRVSVNLEAPNNQRLKILAPNKQFSKDLITPIKWLNDRFKNDPYKKGWKNRWPSLVTQLVIGPAGESDKEVILASHELINHYHLARIYYSKFVPQKNTPLYLSPPTSSKRTLRLYQASFLLRDYHYSPNDIIYDKYDNISLYENPKLTWAKINLINNPVEINKAPFNQLLRIPGIGIHGAKMIVQQRKNNSIKKIEDLKNMGITSNQFLPFILLSGKRLEYQLSFSNRYFQDPTQDV